MCAQRDFGHFIHRTSTPVYAFDRQGMTKDTGCHREQKCASTIGTVLVPWLATSDAKIAIKKFYASRSRGH